MKNIHSLLAFILTIILISISSKKLVKKTIYLEAELYLQKLYSGTNPIDNLRYSEPGMKLRYITLTPKILYYSDNKKEKKQIQEAIYLDDIIDKKGDRVNKGKCCINVLYINYAEKNIKVAKKDPIKSNKSKILAQQNHADYCLEVLAPEEARWRICSKTPMEIYRLHLKLVFAVIQLNITPNTQQKILIEKFLSNSLLAPEKMSINWNWESQKKWGGMCKSSFMQSPLPIINDKNVINLQQEENFRINYNLLDTQVKIVRRYNEIVITFVNDPGYFKIADGQNFIIYRPKYISFRFPSEHVILGKRYLGELQIHCVEIIRDRKKRRTNGFIFSVPLAVHENHVNLDVLESLNIDFWKFEVKESGSGIYEPIDYLTKKNKVFKLSELMKNIMEGNPLSYFYLGSMTTPPCDEFVNHLVVGRPLQISNCQLKILRENSIATDSPKQIHARMEIEDDKDDDDKEDKDGKNGRNGRNGKNGKNGRGGRGIIRSGSGSGGNGGPGGKRGIMAVGKISHDDNIDFDVDEDLRLKPLNPKNGKFKFRNNYQEDEDDLNC